MATLKLIPLNLKGLTYCQAVHERLEGLSRKLDQCSNEMREWRAPNMIVVGTSISLRASGPEEKSRLEREWALVTARFDGLLNARNEMMEELMRGPPEDLHCIVPTQFLTVGLVL